MGGLLPLARSPARAEAIVDVSVKVSGLRELGRALKAVDADLPKEIKTRFLPIAKHVVGVVQQRMPHRSGRAQGSVKARATVRGASIAAGGRAAPYYQWLDFGGSVGRGHVPGVPWSGSVKRRWRGVPGGSGRYIYPAIAEERAEIKAAVDKAVKEAAEAAGFKTTLGF